MILTQQKQSLIILLLLMCSVLAACAAGTQPAAAPTDVPEDTATATRFPTATPTPTLTPTPLPLNGQQTRYEIDVLVNYYNHWVTLTSRSIYTNKTDAPINEMVFIIYPYFWGSIYNMSVKTANGATIDDYRWESHRMVIPLATPLLPGEQIEFIHEYDLLMPEREGTFGQSDRQLNLSYWFPFIPPRNENGWMTYEISMVFGFFVGEHMVFESADFDVRLSFTDRRENMKIAAGAPPQEQGDVIHYHLDLARTFSLSISDIYTISERQVNGTVIRVYTFPEEAAAGDAAADLVAQSVELFTELFGPSERDWISVAEVEFPHNMEFDGLVFLNNSIFMFYNNTPETNLTILTPHEISHQWFFSKVGNNQAMEPWLDEALATYSEVLYYERYHPDLVDWWWENRVDRHLPAGYVDNTIYLEGGYEEYRNSVYLNGAHFIQDLRDAVGDESFFAFLKDYVQKYRYKIATGADFWSTLSEHTDENLAPIQEIYFSSIP